MLDFSLDADPKLLGSECIRSLSFDAIELTTIDCKGIYDREGKRERESGRVERDREKQTGSCSHCSRRYRKCLSYRAFTHQTSTPTLKNVTKCVIFIIRLDEY